MASAPVKLDASSTADEIAELREVFACFDKDSSGSVTTTELGAVLQSMNKNFSTNDLKKIVAKFDANGDGQIDFDEFYAMMTKHEKKNVGKYQAAFLDIIAIDYIVISTKPGTIAPFQTSHQNQ